MSAFSNRTPVGSPKRAEDLLEMYFLDMRCALLETAAALDRIERAEGGTQAFRDPRILNLLESLSILRETGNNRAERFLRLFSEEG